MSNPDPNSTESQTATSPATETTSVPTPPDSGVPPASGGQAPDPASDAGEFKSLMDDDAPTGDEAPKGDDDKGRDGDDDSVPESYDIKLADGQTLEEGFMTDFSGTAKEVGLSNSKANLLIEKMVPAVEAAQARQILQIRKSWQDDLKADKEIGGDNLPETLALAKKAQAFGGDELKDLLKSTGLTDNKVMVGFLRQIGGMLSEDNRFISGNPGGSEKSDAEVLYS